MEIWKDINGYESIYQVSNLGNIRCLHFGNKNSNVIKNLKASFNNAGYLKIELHKDGKRKMFYVHRIVANAFIPNPNNLPQINHIDGDKTNNKISNLEWVTSKENINHAISNNLATMNHMSGRKGKLHPNSKPILQYDISGIFICEWYGIAEASRNTGISESAISNCLNNHHKSSGGFIWKFKTSDSFPRIIDPVVYKNKPNKESKRSWKQKTPRQMHKIIQLTKTNEVVRIWDNYKQIVNETGFDNGNIYKVINGKTKSAYGYIWRYAE